MEYYQQLWETPSSALGELIPDIVALGPACSYDGCQDLVQLVSTIKIKLGSKWLRLRSQFYNDACHMCEENIDAAT